MHYKEIPLTQGKIVLVDEEDFKYLNQFKWHAVKDLKTGRFYAVKNIKKNGKWIKIYMHQEIMKTPRGMETDHINRNSLDNRKDNIRICTCSQNQMNRGKQNNNTSGYKGVFWHKRVEKWMAQIRVNRKQIYLGYFNTKKDAALAYTGAAKQYFGEFVFR